jgi:hypothetical protein
MDRALSSPILGDKANFAYLITGTTITLSVWRVARESKTQLNKLTMSKVSTIMIS